MIKPAQSPESLYGSDFHADRDNRTRATASLVLGLLRQRLPIDSVCDVGCGVGSWLAAARDLDITDTQGFEGPWARTANLVVDADNIAFQDLETHVSADRKFDLAISLEVAEHLTHDRAPGFIADLCALSDCVLFSAAIPLQGGTGHVNEQWQSYWAQHFADAGFSAFDPIRPLIWDMDEVAFWYRQNTLVYARSGSAAESALRESGCRPPAILDLVHPQQYLHAENAQPARALGRKVRQVLGRA